MNEEIKSKKAREILKNAVKGVDESLPEDKRGAILSLRYGLLDAEKNGLNLEKHPRLKSWHDLFIPLEGQWMNLARNEVRGIRDLIEEKLDVDEGGKEIEEKLDVDEGGKKSIPGGYKRTVEILKKAGISFDVDRLGKNVDEKDTILSSRTATDWNVWHCVREVVQNAKDEHTELDIDRPPKISRPSPRILKVRDYGNGLRKEDIIYNRPVKEEEETLRGLYGTGFKRAFIRFMQGYDVTPLLISTNYSIVNQSFEPFGEEKTWSFTIDYGLTFPGGTVVLIEGDEEVIDEAVNAIRHKVLGLPSSIYGWTKISDEGGLVVNKKTSEPVSRINFLMELFVEERDSIFGYNFLDKTMPSDDSRTAFKDWKFDSKVGRILIKLESEGLIEETIRHVFEADEEVAEEDASFPSWDLDEKIAQPEKWKDAWVSVYSEKHVLLTSPLMTEEVVNKGYKPVSSPSKGWTKVLETCGVPTDRDIIGKKGFKAETIEPTEEQKKVLKAALTFLNSFYSFNLTEYYPDISRNVYKEIKLFSKDERLEHDIDTVLGFIPFGGDLSQIHIGWKRLEAGFWPTVSTLFHEIGHSSAVDGGPDKTRAFEQYLQGGAIKIGMALSQVSEMGLETALPEKAGELPGSKLEYVKNKLEESGVDTEGMSPQIMVVTFLTQTSMRGAMKPKKVKPTLKKWGIARKKHAISTEERRKDIKWGVTKEEEDKKWG